MRPVTLLGPQRLRPIVATEVDALHAGDGQVAVITAGWQEREGEYEEMQEHLGRPVVDLRLHRRADEAFAQDEALFHAHRARQDRLKKLQEFYRFRLDFALEPARRLMRRHGDEPLLENEREATIRAVQSLDNEHLRRIRDVHEEFETVWKPHERDSVAGHRDQIQDILRDSIGLCIAGGHVAVLLNRLRLFGVLDLVPNLPIFAWSAGAMALSERIVLFHDSPPQGAGNPEVLEEGLGAVRQLVVLPHARHRLKLDDPVRVALLVRRFGPARSMAFNEGAVLKCGPDGGFTGTTETKELLRDGTTVPLGQETLQA